MHKLTVFRFQCFFHLLPLYKPKVIVYVVRTMILYFSHIVFGIIPKAVCYSRICAYIKCVTEENSGNREFTSAKTVIMSTIDKLDYPEVTYFVKNFIPAYGMTLDEISK